MFAEYEQCRAEWLFKMANSGKPRISIALESNEASQHIQERRKARKAAKKARKKRK